MLGPVPPRDQQVGLAQESGNLQNISDVSGGRHEDLVDVGEIRPCVALIGQDRRLVSPGRGTVAGSTVRFVEDALKMNGLKRA